MDIISEGDDTLSTRYKLKSLFLWSTELFHESPIYASGCYMILASTGHMKITCLLINNYNKGMGDFFKSQK